MYLEYFRNKGNVAFRNYQYERAAYLYEYAIGLFRYLELKDGLEVSQSTT